jgi:hypothetical protein
MNKKDLVAIRPFEENDRNLIYVTWLKGLRFGNDWFESIPQDIYFENYHKVIDSILIRPKIEINIACLKDDPSVILGYVVFESDILHYLFVKPVWRNIGIARDLCPKNIKTTTHLTSLGQAIMPKHITFNPFLI